MSTVDDPAVPPASDPIKSGPTKSGPTTSGPTKSGLPPLTMVAYVLANLSAWAMILTPMAVTMALRVREIDPAGASTSLSLVSAVGAVFGIIANPIFGRLSDRTKSRFGMRRPWLLGGVTSAGIGLVIVAMATSVPVVMLGWAIAQLGVQALFASITAVLPDHVPVHQRGRVGGLISMGQNAATTLGSGLLALNATSLTWGLLAPVGLAVITVVWLCLVLPDRRHDGSPRPKLSVKELLGSYWVDPRRYPDFVWMLAGRLLVFVGITILIVYQAYFLLSRIGVPPSRIAAVMFGVLLLENAVGVTCNLASGWLSDRLGRRKIFVAGAAVVGAAGFVIAGSATDMSMFLVGVTLLGIGKGVYGAVDLALATELLPRGEEDAAKDMGLFIIAGLVPNLLAPVLAPLVLSIGATAAATPGVPAGNYSALFIAGGACMLLGAFAVRFIRGVR
jgi:MFS family permease